MTITIACADAVAWAAQYTGPKMHAMLCDPPYHLTSIVKRFGGSDAAPAQFGKDGAFARASRGFMGKQWDGGDVAFDPGTWQAFANVLHPGAFGMAFASSRGWHRLACAIEDGGFIIHPSIFGWCYGSGFPKATRVNADGFYSHRYGLQALKPALEPIIVFQKPYEGRPIDNITQYGAGALNIDGGRIGTEEITSLKGLGNNWRLNDDGWKGRGAQPEPETNIGRWPSNFILLDDAAADALDAQSGVTGQLVSGGHTPNAPKFNGRDYNNGQVYEGDKRASRDPIDAPGGASRFFYRVAHDIDNADPVYYCAKASGEERNAGLGNFPEQRAGSIEGGGGLNSTDDHAYSHNPHPTVKPLDLARYLATLLLPPAQYAPRSLFVPFAGVASECIGAWQAGWEDVQGIELTEEYIPIANARAKYWLESGWQLSMFTEAHDEK